jgi:hypothetical protein
MSGMAVAVRQTTGALEGNFLSSKQLTIVLQTPHIFLVFLHDPMLSSNSSFPRKHLAGRELLAQIIEAYRRLDSSCFSASRGAPRTSALWRRRCPYTCAPIGPKLGPRKAKPFLFPRAHEFCTPYAELYLFPAQPDFYRKSDLQMTVLRPRSRSISVRLSEEEFAALQAVCAATGARSISDLARRAMQEVLERVDAESASSLTGNGHSVQIKSLERKVEELAAELAMFKVRQAVRRPGA